ncbi:MAG: Hpt domain-containing protein [Proteobacteria bacterium]|jgi:chemotaxis protein histidine kinase CheA|nr:Hpt domain-containing protein [Pseudomonadota bacterium]
MAINQKKYIKLFRTESLPHLQRIKDCADKLSRGEGEAAACFNHLGKSYHYLKGALGLIGLKELRDEAVRMDKILKEINSGSRPATPEDISEFSRVVDLIRETVEKAAQAPDNPPA